MGRMPRETAFISRTEKTLAQQWILCISLNSESRVVISLKEEVNEATEEDKMLTLYEDWSRYKI